MGTTKTYKMDDLIHVGNSVDLTYAKTSLQDSITDIRYIVKNVMYDYIDELLDKSVIITLSDQEYRDYKYKPKLLSYKLYKTTDLSFAILIMNNLTSDKEFDLKKVRVVHPKDTTLFYDILDSEKKYLLNKSTGMLSVPDNSGITLTVKSNSGDEDLLRLIQELEKEMGNIKKTIIESIEGILSKDINEIIANIVNNQLDEIRNTINNIIDNKLADSDARLEAVEKEIANIDNIINTIIDAKLNDKLEALDRRVTALENKSLPDGIQDTIDRMQGEIDDLTSSMDLIISDKVISILEKILEDFEFASADTRDVVINIGQPISLGLQRDTEFTVPYKGEFIKCQMATRTDSIKTSNVIAILQIYNREKRVWEEFDKFNLHVDKQSDMFIMNSTPIDNAPIRINVEGGDMEEIKGLSFVLSIKESDPELSAPDDDNMDPDVPPIDDDVTDPVTP